MINYLNTKPLLVFLAFFMLLNTMILAQSEEEDGITVNIIMPENVKINSGIEVTIEIYIKNVTMRSARFKQIIPEGFEATVINADVARYSFSNNEVKFLFIGNIAQNSVYTLKFKLVPKTGVVPGKYSLKGEFKYAGNGAITLDLPTKNIIVSK